MIESVKKETILYNKDMEVCMGMKIVHENTLILINFLSPFFPLVQALVMISFQMNNYGKNSTNPVLHHLAPNLLDLSNIVTILICLPIMNHLVVPCLQNAVSMKHHIGLGVILNLGTLIASICLEWLQPANRLPWLLLPAVLLSIGEMLVFATGT